MSQHDRARENRALAIRWMEDNWNLRREAVIDELMHPDGVGYMEGMRVNGPADFRVVREELLSAFPDLRLELEAVIAQDDIVAVRWRLRATHTGPGLGVRASGRPVDCVGSTWLRFADGKIVEGHDTWNQGALLAALAA
jgi:predicted ester cyclase